ncbi:MAG TPA: cupin domain-containing protein [Gaiellaceae bacterium]|nr:cupin domain-containing protein [Gaiellaceae bacterium]
MGDYTVKNLKTDVDNAAAQFGIEGMEARFGRKALELGQFGLSYQKFTPNFRQGFGHRHEQQEEAYVVIAGSGRVKVDDDVVELKQWDVIRIAPAATRQFESGPDGMEYLAIGGAPAGDAEIVEGWWTD